MGLLTAVLSKFIVEEIDAWNPTIIRRLIQLAVALLPKDRRERYSEEWQSHINEVPGRVGKLIVAADFLRAAHNIAVTSQNEQTIHAFLQSIYGLQDANARLSKAVKEIRNHETLGSRPDVMSAVDKISLGLSESNEHCSRLVDSLTQVGDIGGEMMTIAPTLIGKLRIAYMRRIARRKFDEIARVAKHTDERSAVLIQGIAELTRIAESDQSTDSHPQ